MPRISFASTTAKLWWLFLHPKSTLIREYPLRGTSQKPWVIQTCLRHPSNFLRAKCNLRCLLPKWSRCLGYSNYTGEHRQKADQDTIHRLLVFMVSASHLQAKSWHTQSPIHKTPWQSSVFHARRDCIHPPCLFIHLSWFLSRPSQRTVSQICAPRFSSSVGYKYRRGRVFGGRLRPGKVEERCGHWYEDVLGRTWRLDEA